MDDRPIPAPPDAIRPGHPVEVLDHFCSIWCRGFEVAESTTDGYLVRRCSDRWVLPVPFSPTQVRPAA